MPFSLLEGAKLSRNPLTRGVMLGVCVDNELISRFQFVEKTGESFGFNREKSTGSAAFVSMTHTAITESSATADRANVPMRLIETDVDVYNYTLNQNDPNGDPRAYQLQQKLKATGLLLQDKMINGAYTTGFTLGVQPNTWTGPYVDAVTAGPWLDTDRQGAGIIRYTHVGTLVQWMAPGDTTFGPQVTAAADGAFTLVGDNPNKYIVVTLDVSDATANGEIPIYLTSTSHEPDGLKKLIPSSQIVASTGANGDALSFDMMDALYYDKVKVKNNLAYLMNAKLIRKFRALVRTTSGGLEPQQLAIPMMGMNGVMGERLVPSYNGVPILQVDDIKSDEAKGGATTLSSVYLASLAPEEGFWGGVQSVGIAQNADLSPQQARIAGFQIYDIGQLEGKGARRTRVEWFGGFALGSVLAAARGSEIVTA